VPPAVAAAADRTSADTVTTIPDASAALPAALEAEAPDKAQAAARKARRSSPLLLLITLVIGVPLLLTDLLGTDAARQDLVLAYGLVAYAGFRLARTLVSRRPAPMDAMFWVFVYVFMAVPALAQITSGVFPLIDTPDFKPSDYTTALFTIWVGLLGYEFGRALVRSRRATERPKRTTLQLRPLNVLIMGAVGIAAALLTFAQHGIAPFLDSRDAATSAILGQAAQGAKIFQDTANSVNVLQDRLVHIPAFVALYLLLVWRHDRPRGIRRPGWEPIFVSALIVINLIVSNPLSNGRFWFGLVGLTLFSVYVRLDNGPAFRKLVVTGILVLLVAFPYLSYFRHSSSTPDVGSPKDSLSQDGSYSAYQMTILGASYVRENGYTNGKQALGAVGFAVPRSMWPGKADDTGTLIGGDNFNRASSLWTEGFVDFGYLGVGLYFIAYGAGVAWVDRLFTNRRDAFVILLMPILCAGQWFILRGSLIPALGALVPLLIAMRLCFKRVPTAVAEPAAAPS
jgi:hypothetical protein